MVFSSFADDQIWNKFVDETNLYATQCLTAETADGPSHLRKHWFLTTNCQIKKLFGLLGYMNVVKMRGMRCYWSTNNFYRNNNICPNAMSSNRLKLLLFMPRFSDDATNTRRFLKIQYKLRKGDIAVRENCDSTNYKAEKAIQKSRICKVTSYPDDYEGNTRYLLDCFRYTKNITKNEYLPNFIIEFI